MAGVRQNTVLEFFCNVCAKQRCKQTRVVKRVLDFKACLQNNDILMFSCIIFNIIKCFRRGFDLVEFRNLRIHEENVTNLEKVCCEYLRIHEENHLIALQAFANNGRNPCDY